MGGSTPSFALARGPDRTILSNFFPFTLSPLVFFFFPFCSKIIDALYNGNKSFDYKYIHIKMGMRAENATTLRLNQL